MKVDEINKEKKIGIITHYYKSHNIGGLLQAYALCRKLSERGFKTEQICYKPEIVTKESHFQVLKIRTEQVFMTSPGKLLKKICEKLLRTENVKNSEIDWKIQVQWNRFEAFEKQIPHSSKVFTDATVTETNKDYDIFVCGSDVIWHPGNLMHPTYYLQFADANKKTISYAASMGRLPKTPIEKRLFSMRIKNIQQISVREKSVAMYIEENEHLHAEQVLDPTLLLNANEWSEIENSHNIPRGKYAFCYFLGDLVEARMKTVNFCKGKNIKLIYLPYVMGRERIVDRSLMEYGHGIYDFGPEDVVALIHYAEYVFTDSFHAVVFSTIFNKRFFAFDRDERNSAYSINARINDFLKKYELQDHYAGNGAVSLEEKDNAFEHQDAVQEKLEKSRQESYTFIKRALS